MPGYVIHLAVGKIYLQNNQVEDIESFEKGIIAPDLIKPKSESHFGPNSSNPDLNRFIKTIGISNSYDEGYFLHLLTDYLFYHRFLEVWNTKIYEDYDILNSKLIQKYGIEIPKEIQNVVQFKSGKLSVLDEEDLDTFINSVGKINIRQLIQEKEEIDIEDINKL